MEPVGNKSCITGDIVLCCVWQASRWLLLFLSVLLSALLGWFYLSSPLRWSKCICLSLFSPESTGSVFADNLQVNLCASFGGRVWMIYTAPLRHSAKLWLLFFLKRGLTSLKHSKTFFWIETFSMSRRCLWLKVRGKLFNPFQFLLPLFHPFKSHFSCLWKHWRCICVIGFNHGCFIARSNIFACSYRSKQRRHNVAPACDFYTFCLRLGWAALPFLWSIFHRHGRTFCPLILPPCMDGEE